MKRFWDQAAVQPVEAGWGIALDGRPLRLPGGTTLHLPTRPLAEAVAEEWATAGGAKGNEMSMEDVPLTRLVGTAVDRIAPDPAPSATAIAEYGQSDLLCYRAEDRRLAALQAEHWQPLLDWAALHHDAPLRVTTGITHVAQSEDALRALHAAVAAHSPFGLSALGIAVPAMGSLVLGLALSAGRIDAAEAHRLAVLDETYQESFWGTDAEAAVRRTRVAADIAVAARLLELSR
ncbi:ATP12 family chaperone protein [Roseomonas xinghualingensis]|uniref:ATP12 family chaperone protein n=1 Tax=Roseomonas xinghualingensis TaxID=2986475 RepID=UPI0021F0D3F6|nr:ATP12 family protein [Roseomonas sp. SXEYE001]MCV4207094.1 chaperone, ATP12 [Roseomonas sp. SXEYE001]